MENGYFGYLVIIFWDKYLKYQKNHGIILTRDMLY